MGNDIDLGILPFHGSLSAFAIQQVNGSTIDFLSNTCLEQAAHMLCRTSSYHGVVHVNARIERSTGDLFLLESNQGFCVPRLSIHMR
jgi:hypothetical protein